jgi:chromosomal replication initiator protein
MDYLNEQIKQLRKEHFQFGVKILSMEMLLKNIKLEMKPSTEKVILFLSDVHNETKIDFIKKTNKPNNVTVRNILMFLLYKRFNGVLTLKEIGKFVGGKDHSTVLHSISKAETMISIKDSYYIISLDIIKPIFNKYFSNDN